MTQVVANPDGSIQTQAQNALKAVEEKLFELENEFEILRTRSAYLKKDEERLEHFFSTLKWLASLISGLLFIVVAGFSILGYGSISDIKTEMRELVPTLVEQQIANSSTLKNSLRETAEGFAGLETDFERYEIWADTLKRVQGDGETSFGLDGEYAYERLSEIASIETKTDADREEARLHLSVIIERGSKGEVRPNTLFNASVEASRQGLISEAHKLATLAQAWQPTLSHKINMLEREEIMGIAYEFDLVSQTLTLKGLDASLVKQQAWMEMLAMVRAAPRLGSEQVYSNAQNAAVRNRTMGYFQQLIDVIKETVETKPEQVTSYAFKSLAELYAWQGRDDWEENSWAAVESAIILLAKESPLTSWHRETGRELLLHANRLDNLDRLVAILEENNIPLTALIPNQ